jgi:hypothetical protein
MLIDQMKEHPEEFRGYAGKFTHTLDLVEAVQRGESRRISMRDATAIMAAAETHLYEVWLAEDVLTMIMKPKEEAEEPKYNAGRTKLGVWQGAVPSAIYAGHNTANTATTAISSQYDQAYQMEMAKYKMEIEKQRQQENEHALRTAKPFKNYL